MDKAFLFLKVVAALAIIVACLKWRSRLTSSQQTISAINRLVEWTINNKAKILFYTRVAQALTGLFLMLLGYYIGKEHFHLIRKGVRAPGTIVGNKQEYFPDRGNSHWDSAFMPIVRFQAGDRVFEFQDWMGRSSAITWKAPVTVLYDPANPSSAMIDRPVWNWIPWAPTFAVGLFLVLVAIKAWLASASRLGSPSGA